MKRFSGGAFRSLLECDKVNENNCELHIPSVLGKEGQPNERSVWQTAGEKGRLHRKDGAGLRPKEQRNPWGRGEKEIDHPRSESPTSGI